MLRKKNVRKNNVERCFEGAKAQSAMEYLMTYGWAILIIAVVLGALFQLGVFNANNFAPKAPPGSCQVFRPNGPYTTSFINLEGICTGELPQYVADNPGPSNGCTNAPSYIHLPISPSISSMSQATIIFWGKGPGLSQGIHIMSDNSAPGCNGVWGGSGQFTYPACSWTNSVPEGAPNGMTWAFYAFTINNNTGYQTTYFNGKLYSTTNAYGAQKLINVQSIDVGDYLPWCGDNDPGNYSNVQFYNTSLSANEILALYQEGIGGAPIDLQHLVGWWPLNGNANDYSGNGNNGQTYNVIFVSNWWSGYTPP